MSDAAYENPTLTEEQRKKVAVGQCNFLVLMIISLTASICGTNASWFCDFAKRTLNFAEGVSLSQVCAQYNLTDFDSQWCNSMLDEHGVGFYNWYATVPVDTQVCVSYTLWVPNRGWVTPNFDSAYEAARVFSIMADIFGAFGFISIIFATCCPMSQDRMKCLSVYFLLASICQSFTFLLHSSSLCEKGFINQYIPDWDDANVDSVSCSLGDGGKQSVTAAVLYFVCAMLAPASLAPKPIGWNGRGGGHNFSNDAEEEEPAAENP